MDLWKRFSQLFEPDKIYYETRNVIDGSLICSSNLDSSLMMVGMTIGEFKQLKGFHGSKKMLKLLTDTWLGRLSRAYANQCPWDVVRVVDILSSPEQDKKLLQAAEKLYKYYQQKLGEVDQETINKVDQKVEELKAIHHAFFKEMMKGEVA